MIRNLCLDSPTTFGHASQLLKANTMLDQGSRSSYGLPQWDNILSVIVKIGILPVKIEWHLSYPV